MTTHAKPRAIAGVSPVPLAAITGNQNVLILLAQPEDASFACGGLIAEACARGRPPFVVVLTDGSLSPAGSRTHPPDRLAHLREREIRIALERLSLPDAKWLLAGMIDGTVPEGGRAFDTVVASIDMIMWARDCHVICAPAAHWPTPQHRQVNALARAVAQRTGLRMIAYADPRQAGAASGGWHLDVTAHLAARRASIEAHASQLGAVADVPAPISRPEVDAIAARRTETILPG